MRKKISSYLPKLRDCYEVDEFGNVYSNDPRSKGRMLTPCINRNGYYQISMSSKDGKKLKVTNHKLVANCFLENPGLKPQVNHIDGNKLNNHRDNLEWCTAKENADHAHKLGLLVHKRKSVSKYSLDDEFICTYDSISEAARDMASSDDKSIYYKYYTNITTCLKSKYDDKTRQSPKIRKSAYGFKWKYADSE